MANLASNDKIYTIVWVYPCAVNDELSGSSGWLQCTSGQRVKCKSRGKPVTGNSRCPSGRPPVPWYRNQKRMSGVPRGRHRSVSALSRQTRRRAPKRRFSVANRPRSRHCVISIISYTTCRRDFARRINFRVDRSASRLWAYKTGFTSQSFTAISAFIGGRTIARVEGR